MMTEGVFQLEFIKTGKSTVETIFTVLHAGGKFGGGGTKYLGDSMVLVLLLNALVSFEVKI